MGEKAPIDFDALEAAEESFRPSWETPEPAPPAPAAAAAAPSKATAPGVAPPAPGSSPSPPVPKPKLNATLMGGSATSLLAEAPKESPNAPPKETQSEPVTAVTLVNNVPPTFAKPAEPAPPPVASVPPPAPSVPPPAAPSVPPVAFKTVESSSRSSRSAPPIPIAAVDPFAKGADLGDDDFVIPKKSGGKGLIFGAIGVAVLAGIGAFVKFGLMSDSAGKTTTTATTASVAQPTTPPPAPTNADIPPPPDKDELAATATASATQTAAPPEPAPAAEPEPAKTAEPTPAPAPTHVAAAPAPRPKTASAPAPAPKPHPAPASRPGKSGGIVRDSPF